MEALAGGGAAVVCADAGAFLQDLADHLAGKPSGVALYLAGEEIGGEVH